MTENVYQADFLQSFPPVLQHDETLVALAQVIANELSVTARQTQLDVIYANIDILPESVLDAIAYDFKVDWYDYGYTLEEKRRTIKASWNVHRKLGTKYAVETAISAIYAETVVKEWWEYGGDPYHFKLILDATYEGVAPEKHNRVLDRVQYYKNLRSHLDGVEYIVNAQGAVKARIGAAALCTRMKIGTTLHAYGMPLSTQREANAK